MESRKNSAFALLPTAVLFGLGIGNLWGIVDLFTHFQNPHWIWLIHIACLAILTAFFCGVARAWWIRGAAKPLFLIVAAAWIFSAPIAAVMGKFTIIVWTAWLLALVACASFALLVAWLFERRAHRDD